MIGQLVDGDGHVMEPRDLWTSRIDKRFRDRAPRVVSNPPGLQGDYWITEGLRSHQAVGGAFLGAQQDIKKYEEFVKTTKVEDIRPGGWNPSARLIDMKVDGVDSCILYPTNTGQFYALRDAAFQAAIFRAYNDWAADFCSFDSKRLGGVAVISLLDIDEAVKEVQRAARLGMRSVLLPVGLPDDAGHDDPALGRVWAAATDAALPVSFHTTQGAWWWPPPDKPRPMRLITVNMDYPMRRALTEMVFTRVFDRFPGLKAVIAEFTIGWIPYFLVSADERYRTRPYHSSPLPKLTPSEYFKRQMWATTIADRDDYFMVPSTQLLGADRFMCSTDYPHVESSWPKSREANERLLKGLSREAKEKISRKNASALYGFSDSWGSGSPGRPSAFDRPFGGQETKALW